MHVKAKPRVQVELFGPTVRYSTHKGNEDDMMATARLYRCDRNTFSSRQQCCSRIEAVHLSEKIDLCRLHRRSHLWEKKSRSVWTKPRRSLLKTRRKSFRSIKTTTTTTTRWHHRRASHTIHAHCLPVLRVRIDFFKIGLFYSPKSIAVVLHRYRLRKIESQSVHVKKKKKPVNICFITYPFRKKTKM